MNFNESSLYDLYLNTITAFLNSKFRENATQPIKITNIHWLPFLSVKTLYIQGLAQNENREYNPIIVFKNVNYVNEIGKNIVGLTASDGKKYYLEHLSYENSNVLVRCNCGDFHSIIIK